MFMNIEATWPRVCAISYLALTAEPLFLMVVGGITDAPLGLIVSIAATLIASGGISSASAGALASLVAALTGSSNVSATAAGLAALGASLTGSGTAVGNN